MQRDLKVGLSLGVLVLGVVGAFLFRRDQVSDGPKPTLRSARQLDERIAERPRTPYMTGDVEFEQEETAANKTRSDRDHSGARPSHTVPPDWMNDEEDPFQVARSPQPKLTLEEDDASDATPLVPLNPRTATAQPKPETPRSPGVLQTHVIQSGDSLSSLAERYLGSQGKFQELYDANRGVLTDPNRLPLGTTIVIPPSTKGTAVAAAKPHAQASTRSLASTGEKARGTITDVSTIEPISPPSESSQETVVAEPAKPAAPAPNPPATSPLPKESKKLFSASRAPFTNHRTMSPVRKPLDPEGEAFLDKKPAALTEPAGSLTGEIRHYQVRKGDSLEKISQKIYGNPKRAADIFAANRTLLASPDALREGQELILPD